MDKNGWPQPGEEMLQWWRDHLQAEKTPGTPIEPHVGGAVHMIGSITWLGDGGPEHLEIPKGSTLLPTASLEWSCDGPGCQVQTDHVSMPPDGWTSVHQWAKYNKHFCSLRCLANWLAGELAKEESER